MDMYVEPSQADTANYTANDIMGFLPETSMISEEEGKPVDQEEPNSTDESDVMTTLNSITDEDRGEKLFTCTHCNESFSILETLEKHLNIHQNSTPFECTLCIKRFRDKDSLIRHVKVMHRDDEPVSSSEVLKVLNDLSSEKVLNDHKRVHIGHKYKCTVCGNEYVRKNALARHELTHTGLKPYVCSYCGKQFNYDTNLKRHIKSHIGEKPFRCIWYLCTKSFIEKRQLDIHTRTHTGEKTHMCGVCGIDSMGVRL